MQGVCGVQERLWVTASALGEGAGTAPGLCGSSKVETGDRWTSR